MPYEASSEFFHLIEKPVATNSDISATVLPISTEVGTVMRNEFSSALQFKNETGALERRMLHYHDISRAFHFPPASVDFFYIEILNCHTLQRCDLYRHAKFSRDWSNR